MLPLSHVATGKVREIYEIDDRHLLMVASDRISAYDVIMDQSIPDKGAVLTGISEHFFGLLDVPHHLVNTSLDELDLDEDDRAAVEGRSMIVRRAAMLPIECVVRGYLYGSAWREYAAGGGPATEHLPSGLEMAEELPEPIFTPATKAASGHDENLTEGDARSLVGDDAYEELRRSSIEIYEMARDHVADRGLIIADTKFEFGVIDDTLSLCDEVLTPDSSRYWPADRHRPGATMPSFDKQYLRDWLDSTGWDHTPPPPMLPPDVIAGTRARYVEAFERITGRPFEERDT